MLKDIREHYGLPQKLFADYLGITRSHLSMAEGGRREILGDKSLELVPLFLAISNPSSSKHTDQELSKELADQKSNLNNLVEQTSIINRQKLAVAERKLATMKADQARSLMILQDLQPLKAKTKLRHMGLFDIIELNARELQKKTSEQVQLKIELQIRGLQAEMEYLKKFDI